MLEATHVFMPELNPILSYLSFARGQLAQFITVGGAALAGNGEGGYQGDGGAEHYLPQIAIIDGRSFEPPPDPAAVGARERLHRAERLRARHAARRDRELRLQERTAASSATRPGEGENAEPPCFEAPPLLWGGREVPAPEARKGAVRAGPAGPRRARAPATP